MDGEPLPLATGAALLLAWGVVDCFLGYRVFKVTMGLVGMLLGGWMGYNLAWAVGGGPEWLGWFGLALGAIAGGLLVFGLYLLGVFLLGAALGFSLSLGFVHALEDEALLVTALVAGLGCGLLALVMQRWLVAAATAWTGALRVVLGAAYFVGGFDWSFYLREPEQIAALLRGRPAFLVAFLVLGALGFVFQLSRFGPARSTKKG